jgi:adenine-specific DNA-methyltransferase
VKREPSKQKLRGGYYTPQPIADFLAHWAIRSPNDTVLEPSCGDGSMLSAAAKTLIKHGTVPGALGDALYGTRP